MKNTFDKDLKQRLDNASLQEAGLHFDKEKLWGKIEKKKAKKRIPFLPWISHTAAVAAGLAVGIFLFVHKDQQQNDHHVVVQQKEVPVLKTITDTVYIVKNEQQHQKAAVVSISKTPQQISVAMTQKTLSGTPRTPDNILPVKEEQPALAVNERVQPKVLHLTDIENENAQPHTWERKRNSFFVTLPDRSQSVSSTESFSMLVAQKLNLTKN
jgi:flagellar basal body-associated protein FliL